MLAGLAPGEAVAKLRVGKLVEAAGGADGEVAPHVARRAEVELLHRAARRLEALVRVLRRDAAGNDVARRRGSHGRVLKVNGRRAVLVQAVVHADVGDAVQRDAHGHLQLRRGQVHARHHLRARMFHLVTRGARQGAT